MIMVCEVDGQTTRYPLELRISAQPTAETPFPEATPLKLLRLGAPVLPALTQDELTGLSDDQLIGRAYPPNPIPQLITAPFSYSNPFSPHHPSQSVMYFSIQPRDGKPIFVLMANINPIAAISPVPSSPTPAGAFGIMTIFNHTTGMMPPVYTNKGSLNVDGRTAEWVIERPTIHADASGNGGWTPDLANYGALTITGYARRTNGALEYPGAARSNNTQITMHTTDTGGNILSTCYGV